MPTCSRSGCGQDALVQWQRRNADNPEHTDAVYGCSQDAISLDQAALVHASSCTAPPACTCTPEPATPDAPADPVALPPGWTT